MFGCLPPLYLDTDLEEEPATLFSKQRQNNPTVTSELTLVSSKEARDGEDLRPSKVPTPQMYRLRCTSAWQRVQTVNLDVRVHFLVAGYHLVLLIYTQANSLDSRSGTVLMC
jgi:hypothetical protein